MVQKPMMKNRPLDSKMLAVLKDLVEHHSSSRGVAEQMGQAHNYVARILRGETKLRLDVLGRILGTIGISESFFLKLVIADGEAEDALEILRFYEPEGAHPVAFIQEMAAELGELTVAFLKEESASSLHERRQAPGYCSAPDNHRVSGHRDLLAELEERRHHDRNSVRTKLESLMTTWVKESRSGGASKARVADLAQASAIWGTIQRFNGSFRDACLAFQVSIHLASLAKDHQILGLALQKSSYLLRDLRCNHAGLILLETATTNYLRAGDTVACAKVFVDRGILLMNLMRFEPAIAELETALRLLPEDEWRNRAASYSNLAHCHEQMGRLEPARYCLLEAQKNHGDRQDAGLAHILANQGRIALACANPRGAEKAFVASLDLLERYGKPLEFAYVALRLAEAYVHQQKIESMRRLADRMLAWLPAIRGNRIADAAMMEWIRCAKWGEVTHQALREARQTISRASKN